MAKKSKHPRSSTRGGGKSGEDAFIEWVLTAWEWAKRNSHTVSVGVVLLALGIAAALYYRSYRQDLHLQATQEFEQVQQLLGRGQPQAAQAELESFLERFGDTSFAVEARILLAQTQLQAGEPDEAVSTLQEAAGRLRDPIDIQAAFLLGTAYEQAERWDEAEALYLDLAEDAEMTFQVREALAAAARIRARRENYAGAAELYRQVLDTYEEGASSDEAQEQVQGAQDRSLYRLRLAEMEAAMERES